MGSYSFANPKVLTPEKRKRVDYRHVGLSHEALVETFYRLDAIVRNVSAEKSHVH